MKNNENNAIWIGDISSKFHAKDTGKDNIYLTGPLFNGTWVAGGSRTLKNHFIGKAQTPGLHAGIYKKTLEPTAKPNIEIRHEQL